MHPEHNRNRIRCGLGQGLHPVLCLHPLVPDGAIEIGGRTKGKPRYHHPDITPRDMLDQQGE
ncbi:MAG TPA: hypothetical protein VFC43_08365 [Methanoregula sp.]|nr:hypothetical protein [Methanoregula sp.]